MQKKLLTVKLEEIFRLIMADLIAQLLEIAKHTLKALPERPPCAPYRVHPRFLPAIQSFLYLHIRKTKTLRGQSRVLSVTAFVGTSSVTEAAATASPGSSRFSKWPQLGRRPWHTADHTADHVSPTRMEMSSKWRLRGELGTRCG